MPDITMCSGGECPAKNKCYRYTAMPSKYMQSYFEAPPHSEGDIGCIYFYEDKRSSSD